MRERGMGWEKVVEVVRTKAGGLEGLWRAVREEEAGWVLFSSVTSMTGNVGQVNYGAANGFLDGFAVRMRERRRQAAAACAVDQLGRVGCGNVRENGGEARQGWGSRWGD